MLTAAAATCVTVGQPAHAEHQRVHAAERWPLAAADASESPMHPPPLFLTTASQDIHQVGCTCCPVQLKCCALHFDLVYKHNQERT
jgi:hypothetical protein